MSCLVRKMTNSEMVDLEKMSVSELTALHFHEETFIAKKILALPPFSLERKKLLHDGYSLIHNIMHITDNKQDKHVNSLGVNEFTMNLLCDLVKSKKQEQNGEKICFFEAGVGGGAALEKIMRIPDVIIKGCDVSLSDNVKNMSKNMLGGGEITEEDIFSALKKQPDASIDIFYADNVIEHLLPDESDYIFKEISRTLKISGCIVFIIPNKHIGPSDISYKFLPLGSKAQGFHFMEMSFNEITQVMEKFGIQQTRFVCCRIPKTTIGISIKIFSSILNKIKLMLEPILAKTPTRLLRKIVFYFCGYTTSVMQKTY